MEGDASSTRPLITTSRMTELPALWKMAPSRPMAVGTREGRENGSRSEKSSFMPPKTFSVASAFSSFGTRWMPAANWPG